MGVDGWVGSVIEREVGKKLHGLIDAAREGGRDRIGVTGIQ